MSGVSSSNLKHSVITWHPLLALVFVVVVYFLSQIIASLAIIFYPTVRHWGQLQTNHWAQHTIWVQFAYVLLVECLTIGALYLFLRWRQVSWQAIGWRRLKWKDPLWAMVFLVLYYMTYVVVILGVHLLLPHLNLNQQQQLGFNGVRGIVNLTLTFISLVVLPPLVEETLMRGFLYSSLRKNLPKINAAIITSIIFAIAHLELGSGAPLLWVAFIDTFILSLFLVRLREKTGGLWAGIIVHASKNLIAFAMLYIFVTH